MALIDRIASQLPRRLGDHTSLELTVGTRQLSPTATRLTPWLAFVLDIGVTEFTFRLCRLPGRKIAEMWDVGQEPWFFAAADETVWEDDDL